MKRIGRRYAWVSCMTSAAGIFLLVISIMAISDGHRLSLVQTAFICFSVGTMVTVSMLAWSSKESVLVSIAIGILFGLLSYFTLTSAYTFNRVEIDISLQRQALD
jgi:hypothetical protein